jgi:osmoprotectant transport system ATP-binding protein
MVAVAVDFRQVSYSSGQRALVSDLSFSIFEGETIVLLGRSGCGKTTTLRLINHLLAPSQGEIWVEGRATQAWNPIELRRRIGYVIQEIGLFPHFTIAQNVGVVPSLKRWKPQETKKRVNELLNLVGLEPERFANRYPP